MERFGRPARVTPYSTAIAYWSAVRGKANARLLPRWTNNRFWNQLGTEPVANGTDAVRHHADLAFAHLESMWEAHKADIDRLIFTVPGFYPREQLGLLLGMARECGIPVAGVVDTAVAAAATKPGGTTLLHLDIFLHRTTLTVLKADTSLRRIDTVTISETGLFTLWDRWANIVASQFIQTSRYDPMHQASSEQRLFDTLPEWIANRGDSRSTRFELEVAGKKHEVAISREQLLQACATIYPQIVQVIRDHIPAGETAALLVSDRFGGFPGLADSLNLIGNAAVSFLSEDAAAHGARQFESAIASGDNAVSHTTSLPVSAGTKAPTARSSTHPTRMSCWDTRRAQSVPHSASAVSRMAESSRPRRIPSVPSTPAAARPSSMCMAARSRSTAGSPARRPDSHPGTGSTWGNTHSS
ncbi:MAG: hypothetical protein U5O39_07750 [Gammaproteobacteria bacterium]|nr:hypothetical protein [Gammaproteobacteria bacterium]